MATRLAYLHVPVVDSGGGDKTKLGGGDPLPKHHLLWHLVRLHLRLHLQVEDLQMVRGGACHDCLQRDHLSQRRR